MGLFAFGQKLRELRESRGLSREQLATESGYSLRGIEQWERGEREPSAIALAKLSAALGVSCAEFSESLLSVDPKKPNRKPGRPRLKD